MSKKIGLLLCMAVMLVMILPACAPAAVATEVATEAPEVAEAPDEPPIITDTELNVLCTPQEEWCQGMKQEFEELYGITVNYVRMSSGEALARIIAEKDAPTFDIWWGGPIDSFVSAKGQGVLETYDSPNFSNLYNPTLMKDVDNQWVGVYVGTLGFATNTNWLASHPDA
ncbi:MAG: hypothetical protein MUO62_05615, partial [Anaerolineales bacterium]|nr:hypothetical protein [Anaerolineales bacterium]